MAQESREEVTSAIQMKGGGGPEQDSEHGKVRTCEGDSTGGTLSLVMREVRDSEQRRKTPGLRRGQDSEW